MISSQMHQFIANDQIRPWKYEESHDLIAPAKGIQVSQTDYKILSYTPEKGQVVVVKAIAPYLMQRTNPDTPDGSVSMISKIIGNRWFSVVPQINRSIPYVSSVNLNAFSTLAGANDTADRIQLPGGTAITDDPWIVEFFPKDPAVSLLVRGGKTFQLTLKALPLNATTPIENPVLINGPNAATRVDFAGAIVYGVTMTENVYDGIKRKWEAQNA